MVQAVMRHAGPGVPRVSLELTIAPRMPVRPLPGIVRVPLALKVRPWHAGHVVALFRTLGVVGLTMLDTEHDLVQLLAAEDGDGDLRVRRRKVQLALEWLCEHSPVYASVTISRANIDARRGRGGSSRCGALRCPLPASAQPGQHRSAAGPRRQFPVRRPPLPAARVGRAHSAALRSAGDYAPHGDVWPACHFPSVLRGQSATSAGEGSTSRCQPMPLCPGHIPFATGRRGGAGRCLAGHGAGHGGWLASGPQATACRNSAEKNEDSAYTAKEALYL